MQNAVAVFGTLYQQREEAGRPKSGSAPTYPLPPAVGPSPGAKRRTKRAAQKIEDHINRVQPVSQHGVQTKNAGLIGDVAALDARVHQHHAHGQRDQGMSRHSHENKRGHNQDKGETVDPPGVMPVGQPSRDRRGQCTGRAKHPE